MHAADPKRDLLAFLDVYVEPGKMDDVSHALQALPEVVGVYEVTGRADFVAVVRATSIPALRALLVEQVMKIDGIVSTVSSVALGRVK